MAQSKYYTTDWVDVLLVRLNQQRLDSRGGYPDQHQILDVNGVKSVVLATVDHNDAPELVVLSLHDFVSEYGWLVDEDWVAA